jgi:hypothetical protein
MNKLEIETAIAAKKNRKRELSGIKAGIQSDLAEIRVACLVRLPQPKYIALQRRRSTLLSRMSLVDKEILDLNAEITNLSVGKDSAFPPIASGESKSIIEALVALRAEYQAFAEDGTRVASTRRMASEFIGRLNGIIRDAVRRKPEDAEK